MDFLHTIISEKHYFLLLFREVFSYNFLIEASNW